MYDMPQQLLIERILKLQRSAIKKSEKLEFLESHVEQLLEEMQKKNKIIHHYIMNEQAGALSNSKSDKAKVSSHFWGVIIFFSNNFWSVIMFLSSNFWGVIIFQQ